jgi:hypothetical protein
MLIDAILNLPNRYDIVTKYGRIQNLHRTTIEWFKHENDSIFMREFVNYIVSNYSNFKTKK